ELHIERLIALADGIAEDRDVDRLLRLSGIERQRAADELKVRSGGCRVRSRLVLHCCRDRCRAGQRHDERHICCAAVPSVRWASAMEIAGAASLSEMVTVVLRAAPIVAPFVTTVSCRMNVSLPS